MLNRTTCLLTLLICAFGIPRCFAQVQALPFQHADFAIYDADGAKVIGHSRYDVTESGGQAELHGDAHFLNGEYDVETDRIDLEAAGGVPALVSYSHDFFNADATPQQVAQADLKSGRALC